MANFEPMCQVIGPESLYEGLDPGGCHFLVVLELLVEFFLEINVVSYQDRPLVTM